MDQSEARISDTPTHLARQKGGPVQYFYPALAALRRQCFNPTNIFSSITTLKRKKGDLFGVSVSYSREVGGRAITVDRRPNQLYPFMGVETAEPRNRSEAW